MTEIRQTIQISCMDIYVCKIFYTEPYVTYGSKISYQVITISSKLRLHWAQRCAAFHDISFVAYLNM